ncbi:hypothetical protein CONLIGDRAFT_656231 [Coniochaeta ligniaria NRRL 30616]|uniref:Heterokaryon incompatibility domain-containing protein n=1 Tax=Coniochaeta ligniaria NRRL 30616 TaxID=1408157 RepID=A0A1J7JB47_9PEZI|nr:hypothetical protein CONLIGDRAFT_656231 [Coniochaeta ligniaria NRRL 30616]
MAFIFKRAAGVLSWLGTPNLDSGFGHFNDTEKDLKSLWLGGLSCKIAHRFAENTVGTQLFSFTNGPIPPWASREPLYPLPLLRKLAAGDRIPRVQDNPYWSRLWVIQEVCLPGNLAFVFGGEVWSEALMRQMLVAADRIPGRIVDTRQQAQMTMEKLLAARKERFTDAMRLELLIERFMHSGCGEMRDRVFGLVGLANDVDSIAMNTTRPQVDWTQGLGRGRGRGLLEIDYTRGFYDIWRDVVSYMYFRAKPLLDFGKEDEEKEDERRIRVVRFAGVVQSAFEGKVEEAASSVATQGPSPAMHQSATSPQAPMCPPQRQMIQAKGYIAGRVVHIGPTYRDFVGSYHEQERWVASWDTHYHAAHDLEKLREMEEAYSTKIINYSETDLARIRHINNNSARAWEILDSAPPAELRRSLPHHDEDSEPVRFLGSEFCMGLAPAGVKLGDLVVRFWNCDAAVVLRTAIGDYPYRTCELVGRADVAEPHGQRIAGMDNTAKDAIRSAKAMYVRLDFETLQLISAGITL